MDIPAFLHDATVPFPDPSEALEEPNGLLAIGGELSSERLVDAYSRGIFPWYGDDQPLLWWSPDPRALLYFDQIKISRSLQHLLKKTNYRVSIDEAFSEVIHQCSQPRIKQQDSWITTDMEQAYIDLHRQHIAHSIEVWQNDELIGGLYGLAMGRAFFGESMFNRKDNAAKIALVYLTQQLQAWGYAWIDCQLPNPFLTSMGAVEVARDDFLKQLSTAIGEQADDHVWQMTWRY